MVDELAEADGRGGAGLPRHRGDALERLHRLGSQLPDVEAGRAVRAVLQRLAVAEPGGDATRVERDRGARGAPREVLGPVARAGPVVHVPRAQARLIDRRLLRRRAVEVRRLGVVARGDDRRLPPTALAAAHAPDLVPCVCADGAVSAMRAREQRGAGQAQPLQVRQTSQLARDQARLERWWLTVARVASAAGEVFELLVPHVVPRARAVHHAMRKCRRACRRGQSGERRDADRHGHSLSGLSPGGSQIHRSRPIDPREHDLFDRAWI